MAETFKCPSLDEGNPTIKNIIDKDEKLKRLGLTKEELNELQEKCISEGNEGVRDLDNELLKEELVNALQEGSLKKDDFLKFFHGEISLQEIRKKIEKWENSEDPEHLGTNRRGDSMS